MDFPTLVYKTPGTHHIQGGTYDYRGVNDPESLESAIAAGWFRTLPEAIAGEHDKPEDDEPPTREELEAKAVELGIEFKKNTGDKVLAEKIAFTLEQKGA